MANNPTGERVLYGGHFYGGHIAFAMDSLRNAVANIADLLDRQMALLVDPRHNNGLPPNLSGVSGSRATINHGLEAVQISTSAWTAEALKLTMPASVFSRFTECHNQDKVSMGTIAARDALRVIELTEQVAAALLIAVRQGVELRRKLAAAPTLQPSLDAITTTWPRISRSSMKIASSNRASRIAHGSFMTEASAAARFARKRALARYQASSELRGTAG